MDHTTNSTPKATKIIFQCRIATVLLTFIETFHIKTIILKYMFYNIVSYQNIKHLPVLIVKFFIIMNKMIHFNLCYSGQQNNAINESCWGR